MLRCTSPRTINVHALSWDQAPNGGACRKGMQYPSECLKRGNEVHFWRLCGHGVCMVDHLQNKNRRGPPAFESFQVHGQFPNQNYTKSNQNSLRSTGAKDTSLSEVLASGPFEKALGSSFDVHRCLSASHVWMKREETGRNQENVSDIFE